MNIQHIRSIIKQIESAPSKVDKIIERSSYGICLTDSNGMFTTVNRAYLDIYRYSKKEVLNKHYSKVVPESDRKLLKEIKQEFLNSKSNHKKELRVHTKDNKSITVNVESIYTTVFLLPHRITFIEPVEY
ncbi:MAG: hypothetical protein CMO01_16165 [Thalassobius sp.]|nr:hypothetical protein [Thalassovita sp.]